MELPTDVIEYIFAYLPTRGILENSHLDLERMRRLSNELNSTILYEEALLWKCLVINEWCAYLPSKSPDETCKILAQMSCFFHKSEKTENLENINDEHIRKVRIHVHGDSKVGKKSLVERWKGREIPIDYVQTEGFALRTLNLFGKDELTYKLRIYDYGGDRILAPQSSLFSSNMFRDPSCVVYVFDLQDRESMNKMTSHLAGIKKAIQHSLSKVEHPSEILVGNKYDSKPPSLEFSQASRQKMIDFYDFGIDFACLHKIPYIQVSAKNYLNPNLPMYLAIWLAMDKTIQM